MLVWIVIGTGVLLSVLGFVVRQRLRPKLDTTIRVGGYTVAQVKAIRRDIFAGRLPADESLGSVALAIAGQAAHNIPIQLKYLPLTLAAVALFLLGMGVAPDPDIPSTFGLVGAVVVAGIDVYLVIASLRALRNSRKVLAANPTAASATE